MRRDADGARKLARRRRGDQRWRKATPTTRSTEIVRRLHENARHSGVPRRRRRFGLAPRFASSSWIFASVSTAGTDLERSAGFSHHREIVRAVSAAHGLAVSAAGCVTRTPSVCARRIHHMMNPVMKSSWRSNAREEPRHTDSVPAEVPHVQRAYPAHDDVASGTRGCGGRRQHRTRILIEIHREQISAEQCGADWGKLDEKCGPFARRCPPRAPRADPEHAVARHRSVPATTAAPVRRAGSIAVCV